MRIQACDRKCGDVVGPIKALVTMQYPHFESGEQRENNYNTLPNLLRYSQSPSFRCQIPLEEMFVPGMSTQWIRRWNAIKDIPDEIGGDM